MISLYAFGPAFGLPDPSPFVMKTWILLRQSGLDHRIVAAGPAALNKAPKGKLPFIDDDGVIIADSTFIRLHLERAHGVDFEAGLSSERKAWAWAMEKFCEDHLLWFAVHDRWLDDANFQRGSIRFFDGVPAIARPVVIALMRRRMRKRLDAQGVGRHSPDERAELARRAIDAMADALGDRPFLTGDEPRGVDAAFAAFVAGALCPAFQSPMRAAAEARANLVAYRDRIYACYFPDFEAAASLRS